MCKNSRFSLSRSQLHPVVQNMFAKQRNLISIINLLWPCIHTFVYMSTCTIAKRVRPQFIVGSHKGGLQDNQDIMSQ